MVDKFLNKLRLFILDDKRRDSILFRAITLLLGVVALIMTFVNIATGKHLLMISTAIYAGCCFANLGIAFCGKIGMKLSKILFQIEMIMLFTFFIVSGTPEGFSAFWTVMLPLCGMLLFGIGWGMLDSGIMFLIVVFLCWTPIGRSLLQYEYTESFKLRFPLLYVAFLAVSFLLCLVLYYTQDAYANQSKHDPLTKAYNRAGLAEYIHKDAAGTTETVGFIIMDLDFFKKVNDTYGHSIGDKVLTHTFSLISDLSPYAVCRWGGEEFSIYCKDGASTEALAKNIVNYFQKHDFIDGDLKIHQTISAGGIQIARDAHLTMDELCKLADECLYDAKTSGRNKAVFRKVSYTAKNMNEAPRVKLNGNVHAR